MIVRGVSVDLPITSHHDRKNDDNKDLIVSINASGDVYVNADKVPIERADRRGRRKSGAATPTRASSSRPTTASTTARPARRWRRSTAPASRTSSSAPKNTKTPQDPRRARARWRSRSAAARRGPAGGDQRHPAHRHRAGAAHHLHGDDAGDAEGAGGQGAAEADRDRAAAARARTRSSSSWTRTTADAERRGGRPRGAGRARSAERLRARSAEGGLLQDRRRRQLRPRGSASWTSARAPAPARWESSPRASSEPGPQPVFRKLERRFVNFRFSTVGKDTKSFRRSSTATQITVTMRATGGFSLGK